MKSLQLYFTVVLITFFLSSCGEDFFSTTLDVEPPTPEDILVTHAFLNFDTNELNMWVSATQPILNNDFSNNQLIGAEVTLNDNFDNKFTVDVSEKNTITYEVNNINANADEVSISVNVDSYERNATASQTIPQKTNFKSFEFFEDGGLDTEGDQRSAIDVVFEDPPGEENFYEVFISVRNNNDPNPENLRATYTNSNDPIVNKGHDYLSVIFDDSTFDGETKTLTLSMYPISESNAKDNLFITWKNVSKDYFRFTKTYKAFRDQEDNPFATPVQIFSNFENGHGIFSVYREQIVPVY